MRMRKPNGRSQIAGSLTVLGIGILCLAGIQQRMENKSGSARLVSIQQLPELAEMCLPQSAAGENYSIGARAMTLSQRERTSASRRSSSANHFRSCA